MELYTYGQPRTGNFIFSKWLSQKPIGSSRVVHHNDLVPHLAPGALSIYAHHQNEVWIRARNSLSAVLCRTSRLEEPRCSHSVPLAQLSKEDHSTYFRIAVGQAGCYGGASSISINTPLSLLEPPLSNFSREIILCA
ncbi:hypothetical protein DSO57_1001209 [Entomophthora muscae]|uniref:Uncharacterized protein n=1 Tax=Entomophthora muscae TaxID=34485 RepID=A0ACC2TWX9_9FUNG|nr:hypothetical protein DSO57_1001209 [Entomophthora muscae]